MCAAAIVSLAMLPAPIMSNPPLVTFANKQEQANRIERQFDALKDRVIAAG